MQEESEDIQFLAPVISRTVNPKETNVDKLYTEKNQRIGWIVVTLSRKGTIVNQYKVIVATLLIVLIGLTVGILFGLRLSGDLINPLFEIIRAVKRIKEGELHTKLNGDSPGELKNLEDGINSMTLSLANSHEEMQRNIKQATRELRHTLKMIERQNIQLDAARKEAIEASEIKSKFLANMSHEIRTPMNGILGFLDLLAKSKLSNLQQEYLETIKLSSNTLLSIINDILDFSKIESGNLILENQPFDLHEEVYNCMMLFKPKVIEQCIDFGIRLDPHLPHMVTGDALRFCQILTNLVSNALKFTEKGGVEISIDLKATYDEKVELQIAVRDTGIGLSQEQVGKLFSAFTQADLSTSRKYGGTGLGLTISKNLIEKMSGHISVISEPGQGSCFTFNVFFDKADEMIPKSVATVTVEKLIVYDQTQYAGKMLISHLETLGIHYLLCESETKLIDAVVEDDSVNIVLVFNELPELQKLKQSLMMDLQSFSRASIFLMANMSLSDLADYSRKLKIKNCLNYPYKPNKLKLFLEGSIEELASSSEGVEHAEKMAWANNSSKRVDVNNQCYTHTNHVHLVMGGNVVIAEKMKVQLGQLILIVDDNPINLRLLHILLEEKGYFPIDAFSAKEALLLAKEHDFVMILTDVHMPEMDGISLCQELRKDDKYRDVPIIAVTADVMEGQGETLVKSGFSAVQIKPIDESALSGLLARYVNTLQDNMDQSRTNTEDLSGDSAEKLIDIALAARLAAGNVTFAKDMLDAFMALLPESIREIVKAYEQNKGKILRDLVHKLHGGASYCGVPVLKEKLLQLEKALQQNNFMIDTIVLEKYEQFIVICDKTLQVYQQQKDE